MAEERANIFWRSAGKKSLLPKKGIWRTGVLWSGNEAGSESRG